jgi:hypothetical protein
VDSAFYSQLMVQLVSSLSACGFSVLSLSADGSASFLALS